MSLYLYLSMSKMKTRVLCRISADLFCTFSPKPVKIAVLTKDCAFFDGTVFPMVLYRNIFLAKCAQKKNATIFSAFSDVSSKSNTLTRLKVISYSVVCVCVCVCFLHTWLTLAGVRTMSRTPVQPAMTPVGTA